MRPPVALAALVIAACAAAPSAPTPQGAITRAARAPAAAALRYRVVILTRPSGSSVTRIAADGTRETAFEVRENGRGPTVEARLRIGADGTLQSFTATGHDTLGTPIDERFRREGGRAAWQSHAERGERALDRPAFYLPLAPMPEVVGLLAAALLRAGGSLPLLPAGEARIERTAESTVRVGGAERRLVGYAITGLELTPTRLWLDEDGSFFGVVDPGFSCVREGFEASIDALVAIQKKLDDAWAGDIARRLAHRPPAAGLAFTHARVFDAERKRWRTDQTVVVRGERITALGPAAATKVPAGAEVIDAAGKALLPGLWDMHTHLGPADGPLNIASGVTTARDLGNDPDRLDEVKARYDEGRAVGPRVLRAGFIEGRGDKAAASKITAETPEEARAAVEFYARRGYEQIKIYNSMRPELVPVLAEAARARGMRVSGHVPVHMRAEEAVRAGYDELNHINMLFLNFFIDKDTDTRTPLRFSIVAERAAGLDLASGPVRGFIALLRQRKTVVDPTVNVFENLFVDRVGELGPGVQPIAGRLPAQLRRTFLTGGLPVPAGKDALYRSALPAALRMVKLLHDAGVPLVAGTDSLGGLMLHRELELHVAAGIPPGDVLQSATLGSARIMRRDRQSGSITPGKDADLFLVDGDPLARISEVRRVVTVLRGGVVYDSAELYEAVGVGPWQAAAP